MFEQVQQQFAGLMARRAFEPVRRHLTGNDADDRLAEGIGMVFEMALRKAEQGVRLDDALLVHAVRLRAVEIRRQFVKGGQPRRDALHRANYTDGRTEVFHIDGFEDEDGAWPREGDVGLQVAWAAALTENPTEKLDSALDLGAWLATLSHDDRSMLADRLVGMSLQQVAVRRDLSVTTAFQRLRRLGEGLAAHSGIEVSKQRRKPRARFVESRC
ncbi:hypothetical protein [Anaeromyxobacter sp. SG64]|uniref:hypothetical protein n=1 Tax=Anaeromyxobacter sp. SG64 TaxID=2925409 RepID=UPI001F581CDD|nr:hypothetical protein [Anaeromyxobacter sp. SG64]